MWWLSMAMAEVVLLSADLEKAEGEKYRKQCLAIVGDDYPVKNTRYFISGKGFRHRVAVEGIENQEDAEAILRALESVPLDFVVYIDGKVQTQTVVDTKQQKMEVVQTSTPKPVTERIVTTPEKDRKRKKRRHTPTVDDVLMHAQTAHSSVVAQWAELEKEKFVFYRKRPQEGSLIQHHFYRKGSSMRLDITIQKGEGMNSTVVLPDEDEAWVGSDEKKVSGDAIRTRELLERFSSTNILHIPYNISQDIEKSSDWSKLESVERNDDVWIVKGRTGVIVQAGFFDSTWLLSALSVRNGNRVMEYVFRDYREVQGIGMVPHVVQIYDGEQLMEEIQVSELDVSSELDNALFESEE